MADQNFESGGIVFFQNGQTVPEKSVSAERPAHLIPRHMLVTGVGRSGTTSCAMLLEALGFAAETPTPYRESLHLRKFIKNNDIDGAVSHLRSWNSSPTRMFWKDPKLYGLAFSRCLETMPEDIGVLFVLRDPLNIALRNVDFGEDHILNNLSSAVVAMSRMVNTILRLRNRNVILVSYEKLLLRRASMIAAIGRFLGITDEVSLQRAINVIEPSPAEYVALVEHARLSRRGSATPSSLTESVTEPIPALKPVPKDAEAQVPAKTVKSKGKAQKVKKKPSRRAKA